MAKAGVLTLTSTLVSLFSLDIDLWCPVVFTLGGLQQNHHFVCHPGLWLWHTNWSHSSQNSRADGRFVAGLAQTRWVGWCAHVWHVWVCVCASPSFQTRGSEVCWIDHGPAWMVRKDPCMLFLLFRVVVDVDWPRCAHFGFGSPSYLCISVSTLHSGSLRHQIPSIYSVACIIAPKAFPYLVWGNMLRQSGKLYLATRFEHFDAICVCVCVCVCVRMCDAVIFWSLHNDRFYSLFFCEDGHVMWAGPELAHTAGDVVHISMWRVHDGLLGSVSLGRWSSHCAC